MGLLPPKVIGLKWYPGLAVKLSIFYIVYYRLIPTLLDFLLYYSRAAKLFYGLNPDYALKDGE